MYQFSEVCNFDSQVFYYGISLNILQLLLGVTVLCVGNPLKIYQVHVNIFVERSNAKMRIIAQKAVEVYQLVHGNISPENEIHLNLRSLLQ